MNLSHYWNKMYLELLPPKCCMIVYGVGSFSIIRRSSYYGTKLVTIILPIHYNIFVFHINLKLRKELKDFFSKWRY